MTIKILLQKLFSLLNKKSFIYGFIILIIIIFSLFFFNNKNNKEEFLKVTLSDFVQQVSVSGRVIADQEVNLSFKNSGIINFINFSVGERVKKGSIIAQIENKNAIKNLKDAEINLADAKIYLEKIKIENSNENLNLNLQKSYDDGFSAIVNTFLDLSNILDGIENILNENILSNNSVRIISKTALNYRNQTENLYYSSEKAFKANLNNFRKISSNSNKTEIESVLNETYNTVKLLTDTLKNLKNFVDFVSKDTGSTSDFVLIQQDIYSFTNTINSHLSELLLIKNNIKNYKDAFNNTDLDIQSALLLVKQKENSLREALNELEDYYIRAPFDGIVTKIDAKIGEIALSNNVLVTLMSDGIFQIESYIPEVNISKIKINDYAQITLDAYGENQFFKAEVISIDPAETIKDGVSTYRTKLRFLEKDTKIKSGMTANVLITIFKKPNTIVLPSGVIFQKENQNNLEDSKNFVLIKKDNEIIEQEIILGEASALGQEIISGLSEGDLVLLNSTK